MKFLTKAKDGGPESKVWAYILIEIKWLFSIILLKFEDGSREAYHSHAFDAISWLLAGQLFEDRIDKLSKTIYIPSINPIFTSKENTHKVISIGKSWALTFRGPWKRTWFEKTKDGNAVLGHGRKVLSRY